MRKRRLLSMLLTAAMCAGLVPSSAYADNLSAYSDDSSVSESGTEDSGNQAEENETQPDDSGEMNESGDNTRSGSETAAVSDSAEQDQQDAADGSDSAESVEAGGDADSAGEDLGTEEDEEMLTVESGKCGDNLTWTLDEEGTLTISGTGDMYDSERYSRTEGLFEGSDAIKKVVVESGVTSIGNYAFYECTDISSIELPEGLLSIGEGAFYLDVDTYDSISPLTEIKLPESLETIGNYAFKTCNGLTHMDLPDHLSSLGEGAFWSCSSLTEVEIPDGITEISDYLFNACKGLTSISIPETVTSIGEYAFSSCMGLTTVNLSTGIKSIGSGAFSYCTGLKEITLPEGITSIDFGVFTRCTNLTSVRLPDSLTSLGSYCFENCSALISITIPDQITGILRNTFEGCTSLTKIDFPDNLTSIGKRAFIGCTGLKSIELPEGLQTIEEAAFYGCAYLYKVSIPDSVTSIGYGVFVACNDPVLICSEGSAAASYAEESGLRRQTKENTASIVEKAVVEKAGNCGYGVYWKLDEAGVLTVYGKGEMFTKWETGMELGFLAPWDDYSSEIKEVVIEDGVTNVSSDAFYYCPNLTSVTLADSVKSIGWWAFCICQNLKTISIPDSVTDIKNEAFYYCTNLTILCSEGSAAETYAKENSIPYMIQGTQAALIRTQPKNPYVGLNHDAVFSISALNAASYQWQYSKDGSDWNNCSDSGADSDTLTVTVTTENYQYQYRCRVTGTDGNVIYSDAAEIDFISGAKITKQPESFCCVNGDQVTFSVTAENAEEYQWYYSADNGKNWYISYAEGADTESVHVTCTEAKKNYRYRCKITGPDENIITSSAAGFVYITAQPQNSFAIIGSTGTFTVTVEDTSEITAYKWYYSKDGGSSWYASSSEGFNTETLSVDVSTSNQYNMYRCKLTNAAGFSAWTTAVRFIYSDYSYSVDDSGVTITGYNGSDTDLTIPTSMGGYPVVGIGSKAFENNDTIVSVNLTKGITSIGTYAFNDCDSLEKVTFTGSINAGENGSGESGLVIGEAAFLSCSSLTDITLPENTESIGNSAFELCSNLKKLQLPESVTSLGKYFINFTGIESITVPQNVVLAQYALLNTNLTSVIFEDGIKEIPSYLFYSSIYNDESHTNAKPVNNVVSIVIPDSVTAIDDYAFSDCKSLSEIELPDNLTSIGSYAFNNCTSLKKMELPENITSLGSYFIYNTGIKSICIPSKVTSGSYSLVNSELDSVTFEDGISAIPDYMCAKSSITTVYIPDSVTTLNRGAFYSCHSLSAIDIPDTVSKIEPYAIFDCNSLKELDIPDALTEIKYRSFCGNESLETVRMGDNVVSIGEEAFSYSYALKEIDFSQNLTTIDRLAFYKCTSLTELNLPDSLTTLGQEFIKDTAITRITIPKNLTTIYRKFINYDIYKSEGFSGTAFAGEYSEGNGPFAGSSLKEVIFAEGTTTIPSDLFNDVNYVDNLEIVVIPEGVTTIGKFAFASCDVLNEIELPASLESAEYAFYGSGIEQVTFAEGTTKILKSEFYNCDNLKQINITAGITEIEKYAFGYCDNLSTVKMADSVTAVDEYAFEYCTNLQNVSLSDNLMILEERAFAGCTSLKEITIPKTLESTGGHGDSPFRGSGLTTVHFSEGLKKIASYLFYGVTTLEEIDDIPDSVITIGYDSFYDCYSLKTVHFPAGLKYIRAGAFEYCKGLTEIELPEGLESIGSNAFKGCEGLTEIELPEGLESIDSGAFGGCEGLTEIELPEGLESIGSGAFGSCSNMTKIVLPDSLEYLGGSFIYGTGIKSITIPKALKNAECFEKKGPLAGSGVTEVIFEDGMVTIPANICSSDSGMVLDRVVIPESVTSIGNNAFLNCTVKMLEAPAGSYAETYAKENGITFNASIEDEGVTQVFSFPAVETRHLSGYGGTKSSSSEEYYWYIDDSNEGQIQSSYTMLRQAIDSYMSVLKTDVAAGNSEITNSAKATYEYELNNDDKNYSSVINPPAGTDQDLILAAYEGFGAYTEYVRDNNAAISKVDLSQSTKTIANKIVDEVFGILKRSSYSKRLKSSAGYIVDVDITGFGSAFTGSIQVQNLKKNQTVQFLVNSTTDAASKAMATYLKNLTDVAEDAVKQGLQAYLTEFNKVTCITEFTKDTFVDTLSGISDYLKSQGYGKVMNYAEALYIGYSRAKSVTSKSTLVEQLKASADLYDEIRKMDFSDSSINDKATKEALSAVEKYRKQLENQLYNYIYHPDEDVSTDVNSLAKWWNNTKSSFAKIFTVQCPVEFVVYDENGNEIGRTSNGDCEFTDDIYITVCGDVKTIYVPGDMNVSIEMIGTDSGTMNYTVEEYVNAVPTGRVNYFDVPLEKGITYSQDITASELRSDGAETIADADGTTIDASEYISVGDDALCTVTVDMTEGGYVDGAGEYAKGDSVVLIASSDDGYRFGGWYDENGNLVELSTFYHFTATEDAHVYAEFKKEKKEQTITCESSYDLESDAESFNLNAGTDGDGLLSYYSDNEEVVQVTSNGQVEVTGAGKATIYILAAETGTYNTGSAEISVTVTGSTAVSILENPSDVTVGVKHNAVFSVTAENAASYQWQYSKNGTKWYNSTASGAKTDTLTVTVSTTNYKNLYRCKVTGNLGDIVYSDSATVDLIPGAKITSQPVSVCVLSGEKAAFTVAADNATAYQWFYSKDGGTNWFKSTASGADTETLNVTVSSSNKNNLYKCKITGTDENVISSSKVGLVVIAAQPENSTAAIGTTGTFTVKADSTNPIDTYKWYYSKDSGATWYASSSTGCDTDTLSVKATTANRTNLYRCKLTSTAGLTGWTAAAGFTDSSDTVKITEQPVSVSASVGDRVSFTVTAENVASTGGYQWYYSKDGKTWYKSGASGNATDTLTITVTNANKSNQYKCKVTGTDGTSVTSDIVSVQ